MKEVVETVFIAFDSTRFAKSTECLAYEREHSEERLAGLTIEQVRAAVSGADRELADVIERLGDRIKARRLEAGELNRKRKGNGEAADPESRGAVAFSAGQSMAAPEDLKLDPTAADGFRRGYSRACAAAEAVGLAPTVGDIIND